MALNSLKGISKTGSSDVGALSFGAFIRKVLMLALANVLPDILILPALGSPIGCCKHLIGIQFLITIMAMIESSLMIKITLILC